MKFVVPARKSQSKYIINKLKYINNSMSLSVRLFSLILNSEMLRNLLLFNNVDDNLFKIFVTKPHVYLAELLLSLVNLFVFDNIVIN